MNPALRVGQTLQGKDLCLCRTAVDADAGHFGAFLEGQGLVGDHQRGGSIQENGIAVSTGCPIQKGAEGDGVLGRGAAQDRLERVDGQAGILGVQGQTSVQR